MASSNDNSDNSRDENVQQNPTGDQEDEIIWDAPNEVALFSSMMGHKPVGVSKSFQMACIMNKFSKMTNYNVSSEKVWRHLGTMYDLKALDEREKIPFDTTPEDYEPPDDILEIANEIEEKEKETEQENKESKGNQPDQKKEAKRKSVPMPKAEPSTSGTAKASSEKVKSKIAEGQTKKKDGQQVAKTSSPKLPAAKGIKAKTSEPSNKVSSADVSEAKTPDQEQKEGEGGSKTAAKDKPVAKAIKSEPKSQQTKGKGRKNQKSANKGKN